MAPLSLKFSERQQCIVYYEALQNALSGKSIFSDGKSMQFYSRQRGSLNT